MNEQQEQYGLFRCASCDEEHVEEVPPIWGGVDFWPTCCEELTPLIDAPVEAPVVTN